MEKQLTTLNLILRTPRREDLSSLKAFEDRNKGHLAKWETITDVSSDEDTHQRLMNWQKECEEGKAARFFIFTKENPDQIIGMCNFTQIFRGVFQACYLGYKIDQKYEGQGFMFEALQKAIQYVFEELKLHRIMANYIPINKRSAKLLNRLGFAIEGFAKNYLLINNRWEDHILTALSYEQWITHQENRGEVPMSAPFPQFHESYRQVDWKSIISQANHSLNIVVYYWDKWVEEHRQALEDFLRKPHAVIRFFFSEDIEGVHRLFPSHSIQELKQKIERTHQPLQQFLKDKRLSSSKVSVHFQPHLLNYALQCIDDKLLILSFFEMFRKERQVDSPAMIIDLEKSPHLRSFYQKELMGFEKNSKK